jgi:hypothetical protein
MDMKRVGRFSTANSVIRPEKQVDASGGCVHASKGYSASRPSMDGSRRFGELPRPARECKGRKKPLQRTESPSPIRLL